MAEGRAHSSEVTDLEAVVRKVADHAVEAPGGVVDVSLDSPESSYPVRGAEEHLAQVVLVLIENAIKFSPETMPVEVRLTKSNDSFVLIDLGIDELFVLDDVSQSTPHPGRMAPNTAL